MKKLWLLVFFLVTWTIEKRGDGLNYFSYNKNEYQMRQSSKDSKNSSLVAEMGQKTFSTLEAASKFIREAPKERSDYGDRVFDFHIDRVEKIK